MRQLIKSAAKVSAVSAIACALTFVSTLSANAQSKKGLEGHYVGGSFQTGGGITSLNIYGRYDYPKLPISVRGSIAVIDGSGDTETFFQPAVTYDLPISDKANAYAGAGVAFSSGDSDSTAFLNAGAETEIATNVVAFADLIIPFDDDADTGFGIGLGYRF